MTDTHIQDESGASAPRQVAPGDQDAPMAYIDRLVAAEGVEDAGQDDADDDEWLEEEYVEDLVKSDDDDKSYSDDEEMYDSESDDGVDIDMLCAETTVPREPPQPKELSAEAKLDLTWRLDKDESYSDWTIEIIASSDDEDADEGTTSAFYHVHKTTLATGRRKSEYFDSIFSSEVGRFQESESSTSRISLAPDMAATFPEFLDYLYAPFSEASCVLNTDNALQLRSLASYFIVQSLTDATRDFIIDDMTNLDRMGKYLKAALERKEEELIGHAVQICASSIGGIETDSSLLLAMPPAFFLTVVVSINRAITRIPDGLSFPDDKRKHILRLSISYLQHVGELVDKQYFRTLEKYFSFPPKPPSLDHARIGLDFLKLIKKYGWERQDRLYRFSGSPLEDWCVDKITKYLEDPRLGPAQAMYFIRCMNGKIPDFAAEYFWIHGFSETRSWKRLYDCKKCNKNKSTFALIPCGHMLCSSCARSMEASECPICKGHVADKLGLKT